MNDLEIEINDCDCLNHYTIIESVEYYHEGDDIEVEYKCKKAICDKCGFLLMIDEIEHYNQQQFEKEYHKKYGGKENDNYIRI